MGAEAQPLPHFWRAGDAGSIRTTAGLSNLMTEFDNRRTRPQCQSIIPVARVLIICIMLIVFRVMSQGLFLVLNALTKMQCSQATSSFQLIIVVGGSLTVPHSARREQRYQCEMRGEKMNDKSLFI